jgi:hypothetical protein
LESAIQEIQQKMDKFEQEMAIQQVEKQKEMDNLEVWAILVKIMGICKMIIEQ